MSQNYKLIIKLTYIRHNCNLYNIYMETVPETIRRFGILDISEGKKDADLTCLHELEIWDSGYLSETLPETIGNLTSLKRLRIFKCESLMILPETIGNLTSLQELDICGTSVETLPETIGNLTSLKKLTINRCEYLKTLPETIGNLTSLKKLNIDMSISSMPETIGNLTSLQ
jgi:Leucine-rich repeat (LRR) protein